MSSQHQWMDQRLSNFRDQMGEKFFLVKPYSLDEKKASGEIHIDNVDAKVVVIGPLLCCTMNANRKHIDMVCDVMEEWLESGQDMRNCILDVEGIYGEMFRGNVIFSIGSDSDGILKIRVPNLGKQPYQNHWFFYFFDVDFKTLYEERVAMVGKILSLIGVEGVKKDELLSQYFSKDVVSSAEFESAHESVYLMLRALESFQEEKIQEANFYFRLSALYALDESLKKLKLRDMKYPTKVLSLKMCPSPSNLGVDQVQATFMMNLAMLNWIYDFEGKEKDIVNFIGNHAYMNEPSNTQWEPFLKSLSLGKVVKGKDHLILRESSSLFQHEVELLHPLTKTNNWSHPKIPDACREFVQSFKNPSKKFIRSYSWIDEYKKIQKSLQQAVFIIKVSKQDCISKKEVGKVESLTQFGHVMSFYLSSEYEHFCQEPDSHESEQTVTSEDEAPESELIGDIQVKVQHGEDLSNEIVNLELRRAEMQDISQDSMDNLDPEESTILEEEIPAEEHSGLLHEFCHNVGFEAPARRTTEETKKILQALVIKNEPVLDHDLIEFSRKESIQDRLNTKEHIAHRKDLSMEEKLMQSVNLDEILIQDDPLELVDPDQFKNYQCQRMKIKYKAALKVFLQHVIDPLLHQDLERLDRNSISFQEMQKKFSEIMFRSGWTIKPFCPGILPPLLEISTYLQLGDKEWMLSGLQRFLVLVDALLVCHIRGDINDDNHFLNVRQGDTLIILSLQLVLKKETQIKTSLSVLKKVTPKICDHLMQVYKDMIAWDVVDSENPNEELMFSLIQLFADLSTGYFFQPKVIKSFIHEDFRDKMKSSSAKRMYDMKKKSSNPWKQAFHRLNRLLLP